MKNSYTESLSHTTWECKYHVVFAPKFRRQEIYGKLKKEIGLIIRELCRRKEVEIIEAEACKDHIHLLVSIPPKISISSFMGYLKGKSSLIIFERHANLKYKYGNRVFWAKGYFVSTVGKNKKNAVVGSKIPLKRLLALVPYRAQRKTTCYTRGFLLLYFFEKYLSDF